VFAAPERGDAAGLGKIPSAANQSRRKLFHHLTLRKANMSVGLCVRSKRDTEQPKGTLEKGYAPSSWARSLRLSYSWQRLRL
jgi:hypothetical protein